VGAYYLWVSFVVSFGKRMVVSPAYAAPVTLLVACLLLRMAAGRWKRPAS
jgi:sulfoxide reductase heme-binding subunit YedZ